MSGVFGWVGVGTDNAQGVLDAMAAAAASEGASSTGRECGAGYAAAATGLPGTAALISRRELIVGLYGHPLWQGTGHRARPLDEVAGLLIDAFIARDVAALGELKGDYALALIDPRRNRVVLAVDRMSVRNVVYAFAGGGLVFGPSCTTVSRHPGIRSEIDPQGLYNYLHFHMVPGPATVFRDQHRVPPGHWVDFVDGECSVQAYWRPHFVENERADFAPLKRQFRATLHDAVTALVLPGESGTFLSGGTDSSTLAGILGAVTGAPARTFSIGFAAQGYDETHYARTAARHFETEQHEYYVTPADVVAAIPMIAQAYDQPFGNASAVPTYYCARLAHDHGVRRMLGGDGGDELFGGNSRYAKQQQFERYHRIPAFLRRRMIEPAMRHLPLADRATLARKAVSYVAQAAMPMPQRYDSYNLLERIGARNVLTADFLASVDCAAPWRSMRQAYEGIDAKSLINRMLGLDFEYTLADNDLPKVTRMCESAGIDVAFPMLYDDLIDFSLKLPPQLKLRGTQLRYFFKKALADFLPAEIIAKEKHGFGLPTGVWLQAVPELRAIAGDSLSSLRKRGIVRPEFIDQLLDQHLAVHAGYYGTMVWILLMLELWFQRHTSAVATTGR